MSPTAVILTYAAAAAGRVDAEHLAAVAASIRNVFDNEALYQDVRTIGDTVRFTVGFTRWPEYGATNLARGLVGRALREAGVAGRLVEVACAEN